MDFFICNYLGLEGNKTVGITFNKLHVLSPSYTLPLTSGKVTAVISYLKWNIWYRGNYRAKKNPHAPHFYLREIKTPRGHDSLINGIQSHSMYLDFVLKKLDWGESIPEPEAELWEDK